jgi:hypothetical protein
VSSPLRTSARSRRLLARRLWLPGALLVAAFSGCGGSDDGPASYIGRASNAVVYVSWTKTKDSLSGQLTQARAVDDVSKGIVDTERVSFDGMIDGKAVSLRLNEGLGSTSTLTGKLDGDMLALDYPGRDGAVITIKMGKGDSAAFNAALAALRDKTTQAKQDADQAAADQQAREDAVAAADGVRTAIGALGQAADNATATGPDLYSSDLDTISSDLDTVKSSYEVLTQDVENGNSDTICDDASVIGNDVDNLKDDIGALHSDVKTTSDAAVLDGDIRDLRQQFEAMQSFDPSMLPDDAPTQDDVDQGIRAARRKVRTKGRQSTNFVQAQALLAKAQAIKAPADAACQAHGA